MHFTVMSTEHFFGPGSQQHLWLEADLAAVNRSRTPWLLLVGHRWVGGGRSPGLRGVCRA